MSLQPTLSEASAIKALKAVAKHWPKTLWLFSASGTLCVMRKGSDGHHAKTPGGGIDPAFVLDEVKIENDGGDW